MEDMMPTEGLAAGTVRDLELCNRATAEYGLALTNRQMLALAERRVQALRDADRVEFGEGVLKKLVFAFRDSPYLDQAHYEETLTELQDIFYFYKNESGERLSDDELIAHMRGAYNGWCRGSLEALAGTELALLCRRLRGWEAEEAGDGIGAEEGCYEE
ncbi:DUF6323 family protein [Lawsonibacter faecis]|uniref:Uncharacterized protein n=1 Tax=Lawsonibacter faecis TaxID=2763052 RepID=A0A8J6JCD7_9FIRM|nr:DUF6323 family protein [Lawsonibacter faecis]MBC5736891.1 hypothetical protein [Lawsonibacter faecis]